MEADKERLWNERVAFKLKSSGARGSVYSTELISRALCEKGNTFDAQTQRPFHRVISNNRSYHIQDELCRVAYVLGTALAE